MSKDKYHILTYFNFTLIHGVIRDRSKGNSGGKKKPSNAILQDVDKNAEKNEEDIDNRNKHVIKPISEAESSAWDEPTV